jgi:hypothetical protein
MSSTRIKILMEKSRLESMHYCYLTIKNILGLKKNTKEMDFQIHKFLSLFGPPYHALTLSKVALLLCNVDALTRAA